MARKIGSVKTDELEPYRQLIEIQKQLVKLSRQHEKTKRECAELRERLAREVMESRDGRKNLRQSLQRQADKVLKRLPRLAREGLLLINGPIAASQKLARAAGK